MDIKLSEANFDLTGIDRINILLGKNGVGKSKLLRSIDTEYGARTADRSVRYISPERGGLLAYDPNIENNVANSQGWLETSRRANQYSQFKQQTMIQYRNLESLVQRELEAWVRTLKDGDTEITKKREDLLFDNYLAKINMLLDNVRIARVAGSFKAYDAKSGQEVGPAQMSSGESELVTLGIEMMAFEKQCSPDKTNVMLLDEPDVHLHPDLQARLMRLLISLVEGKKFIAILATHSTALLGSVVDKDYARVAFVTAGQHVIHFDNITEVYKRILPVFGAHPLSNVFNQAPVLLLEGEDDERIWQQAIRSSHGKLRVFPCPVDSKDVLNEFEQKAREILVSIYDDAKGYSLRDRDDQPYEIEDLPPLLRFRLQCRSAENLVLSDEVLALLGLNWDALRTRIEAWLAVNATHPHYDAMLAFKNSGFSRIDGHLKDLRNDFLGLVGTAKPWENAVGQAIGRMFSGELSLSGGPDSIATYLGPKLISALKGDS